MGTLPKLGIVQVGGAAITLADLIRDPARITDLPREAVPQLRGDLAHLDTLLLSRLFVAGNESQAAEDQLLDVPEAARRLGISEDYLYRHHKDFAFTRHMGRKLLFAARGIEQYISQKKRL
jgi:predicted DNA-binding transcriptional regulator AlpA